MLVFQVQLTLLDGKKEIINVSQEDEVSMEQWAFFLCSFFFLSNICFMCEIGWGRPIIGVHLVPTKDFFECLRSTPRVAGGTRAGRINRSF